MPIRTRELTPHTGAKVLDYDLSRPVDPTTLTELESVFHDRGMLVFKNQSITEDHRNRASLSAEVVGSTPAEFKAFFHSEVELYRRIAATASIHLD
jgi:alpha-ketoglutarate-dependent taurine dioxygenase